MPMKKIGVSGSSGKLGRKVLSYLIESQGDHQIVAISRSPEAISSPAVGRHGDYDNADSLVRAYEGIDRLLLIPSADLRPGIRGNQLKAAIDAALKAGVKHLVLMSAAGTKQEESPALGEAYWTGEQHLIKTAPQWTILRMNFYSEAMADEIQSSLGMAVLTGFGEERVAYVSRDDVAAAAAALLLSEGHTGAIYNATGPATISGAERASIVSEITGKQIGYAIVTHDQLRAGLALANFPENIVDAIITIKSHFTTGSYDILTGDVERLSGRPPKTLREILVAALQ